MSHLYANALAQHLQQLMQDDGAAVDIKHAESWLLGMFEREPKRVQLEDEHGLHTLLMTPAALVRATLARNGYGEFLVKYTFLDTGNETSVTLHRFWERLNERCSNLVSEDVAPSQPCVIAVFRDDVFTGVFVGIPDEVT